MDNEELRARVARNVSTGSAASQPGPIVVRLERHPGRGAAAIVQVAPPAPLPQEPGIRLVGPSRFVTVFPRRHTNRHRKF